METERERRVDDTIERAEALPMERRDEYVRRSLADDPEALEAALHAFRVQPASTGFLRPPDLSGIVGLGEEGDLVGRSLGEFEILERIGSGGMGIVYRARQSSLGREVAIKVLDPVIALHALAGGRFENEARSLARVEHPGIVRVICAGKQFGIPYIAMELVRGPSLASEIERLIKQQPAEHLPPVESPEYMTQVVGIVADAAEALAKAHAAGVIHRDLKPENLLLDEHGHVRIVDFGLARDETRSRITRDSDRGGTFPYMSPEQIRDGNKRVDARTDVYSLGVVLYELAALQRPFDGRTPAEVLDKIVRGDPPKLRSLRPLVPRDLEIVCGKAMSRDADSRYADAGALSADLRRFLSHEAIHAMPPSAAHLAFAALRRHRRVVVGAAMLVAGVALGLWSATTHARNAPVSRLWVEARDEARREAIGHAILRPVDLLTGIPGAPLDLGPLPVRVRAIPTGYHRVILDFGERRTIELARMVEAGNDVRIGARVPAVSDSSDMIPISGGTLMSDTGIRVSSIDSIGLTIEPFLLDACEVSNAEYRRFLETTNYPPPVHWERILPGIHDDLPVVGVGWTDARAYAEWRGKRLPTFPEWMWAARGSEGRLVPWSAAEPGPYRGNTLRARVLVEASEGITAYLNCAVAVRSHEDACTPSGLYHMLGNVSEWTETVAMEPTDSGFVPRLLDRLVVGPAWDAANRKKLHATLAWFAYDGVERTSANHRTGFRCARSAP